MDMKIELLNKDKQVYNSTFVLNPKEMRAPISITFNDEIYNQVPNGGVLVLRISNADKKEEDEAEPARKL